jgi:hypothetical protein
MQRRRRQRQHSRRWNEEHARRVVDEWKQSGDTIATTHVVPATIVSTNAVVIVQLPDRVAIEIANASPAWVAVVSELVTAAERTS